MKWFRHMTNASDEQAMIILTDKFGAEGYGIYFMIVERIARTLDDSNVTSLTMSHKSWYSMLKTTSQRKSYVRAAIELMNSLKMIEVSQDESNMTIKCDNLLKYRDEWTSRKQKTRESLGSHSGVTHKVGVVEKEKNKKELSDVKKENKFYAEDSFEVGVCHKIADMVLELNPKDKNTRKEQLRGFVNWANDIYLLKSRDERTETEIKLVLDWLKSNSKQSAFWRGTKIRSGLKFREKFDMMYSQMTAENRLQPTGLASPVSKTLLQVNDWIEKTKVREREVNSKDA